MGRDSTGYAVINDKLNARAGASMQRWQEGEGTCDVLLAVWRYRQVSCWLWRCLRPTLYAHTRTRP
jgi:hypothetical protein